MTLFDHEDLQERLAMAGYAEDEGISKAVMKLAFVLDNEELSDTHKELVMNLFNKTTLDQIKALPLEFLGKNKWVPFDYGNVKKGDYVRVRYGAYDSETGQKHNGRLGTLIDMKAWRCKVQYIGMPNEEPMTHPMDNLESIKKV